MKYSSRFFLYAPLVLLLGLACFVMGHWWLVAAELKKKLDAMNGQEAVPGITIAFASKTISGFPFNIDVVFTGFAVRGAGAHGPFAWTSDRFALHALTYGRKQHIYEAAGQQTLSWTDDGSQPHRIAFLPGSMRASAITDAKGLARFDLDIVDAGGKDSDGAPFTVGRAQFHVRRDPGLNVLDLVIGAEAVKTQSHFYKGAVRDELALTQGDAFAPLLAGAQSWPTAVAVWRKAGGVEKPARREIAPGLDATAVTADILNSLY